MSLFKWDNPDASADENSEDFFEGPEDYDQQVGLPIVDKIEMKGALEAYSNTLDTDYDGDAMAMAYDFYEQGLYNQSVEDTNVPSAKRYRRSIDWHTKAVSARYECLDRDDKTNLHNKMKQCWVKRWLDSRPTTWQLRTDLKYGDKRALAHNAFLLLGDAERRKQCLLMFNPDDYKKDIANIDDALTIEDCKEMEMISLRSVRSFAWMSTHHEKIPINDPTWLENLTRSRSIRRRPPTLTTTFSSRNYFNLDNILSLKQLSLHFIHGWNEHAACEHLRIVPCERSGR
jgi:hypothetical protein